MRFVTFEDGSGHQRTGIQIEELIVPLDRTSSLLALIKGGSVALDEARRVAQTCPREQRVPLADVKLLAPMPYPAKNVFCVGRNYHEHVEEGDKVYGAGSGFAGTPPAPIFFTKPATSIVGPDADVLLHPIAKKLDYEIELGVIIGTGGVDIPEADALEHVWGYTIINDITARDLQDHHKQWFKGKGLDTFCPMGPSIVLRADIADPHALEIELTVNGQVRQKANTSQMIFDIPRIISELSAAMTLEPGDVIATGTCSGCAFAMDPPAWLQPGDVIVAHIQDIGALRNTVRIPT